MSNLEMWDAVRNVPETAKKEIKGGRLSGKTDINPVWRLKVLTEQFGVCGFGWKYEITKQWIEKAENGEAAAFVNIDLYIKQSGEWSAAIPGNGGNMFIAQERNGPYVSDECFKMALTDAISVACKTLGFGADVYWEKDSTKYDKPQGDKPAKAAPPPEPIANICHDCNKEIIATTKRTVEEIITGSLKFYKVKLCAKCSSARYVTKQNPDSKPLPLPKTEPAPYESNCQTCGLPLSMCTCEERPF